MLKKVFTGAACLVLVLALFAACSVKPVETEDNLPTPEQTAAQSNDLTEPEDTQIPTQEPTEPTTVPPINETVELGGPVRGTWSGNVYSSEFSGLSFTLPEGWVKSSDEEIAALLGIAEETLTDEEAWMLEAARLTSIYDMLAMNSLTGDNVIIMYENIALTTGGMQISETDYLEILEAQLQSVQGTSYQFDDVYETDLSGMTFSVLPSYDATSQLNQYYAVRMQDDYMIALVITAQFEDFDEIMACFA